MWSTNFLTLLILTWAHALRAGQDAAQASENGCRGEERKIPFATDEGLHKAQSCRDLGPGEFSPAHRQLTRAKIPVRADRYGLFSAFARQLAHSCLRLRHACRAGGRWRFAGLRRAQQEIVDLGRGVDGLEGLGHLQVQLLLENVGLELTAHFRQLRHHWLSAAQAAEDDVLV